MGGVEKLKRQRTRAGLPFASASTNCSIEHPSTKLPIIRVIEGSRGSGSVKRSRRGSAANLPGGPRSWIQ
jgi:hypothetical protein